MNTDGNLKSKLAQWWESLSPKIDEAYHTTKDKAGDFSRIGKLKYEVFQTRRILLKCYQELGEKTTLYIDDNKNYDLKELESIDSMLEQVKDLKTKISTLENEITHLQAEEKIK
jgi:murein L,D-transpeptidase YafK